MSVKNLFAFSGLLLGVTCTILAVILFKFGRLRQHRMMAFYNVAVAWWGYGCWLMVSQAKLFWEVMYGRVAFIGVTFIPVFFLHTIAIFCNSEQRLRAWLRFAYLQAVFFLFLLPTELFFSSKRFHMIFSMMVPTVDVHHNLFFVIYVFIWGGLFLVGHFELFKYLQKAPKMIRGQTFFVLMTWIIIFLSGFSLYGVLFKIPIYPFGNFVLSVYYCLLTYLVFKYRFIDVVLVSVRLLASVAVYILVFGVPLMLGALWQEDLVQNFGSWWWLLPVVTATVTATLGAILYSFLDKKTRERIMRQQRNYQLVLKKASGEMIRFRDFNRLLQTLVQLMTDTAKIQHAGFYLFNPHENRYDLKAWHERPSLYGDTKPLEADSAVVLELQREKKPLLAEEVTLMLNAEPQNTKWQDLLRDLRLRDAAVVVPSFIDEKLAGVLMLGEKQTRDAYTNEDVIIFSVLANQVALAVENVQFYDRIQQARDELAVTEKLATIGTMANCLSHLINNRFQAISLAAGTSLDMLKNSDTLKYDDDVKNIMAELVKALEDIVANVFRGAYAIKGLLDYSKPGEDGFSFMDIDFVLDEAIQVVQAKIYLQEIELIKNVQTRLEKLYGNWMQLEEVFINLLDNAYDAIVARQPAAPQENQKGRIELSVLQKNDTLEIKIKDNGIGIKSENIKMLFTPFFTTKATSVKGKGLGLYVIQKIMKAHNGSISIDSQYQIGTTVTLSFPLCQKGS